MKSFGRMLSEAIIWGIIILIIGELTFRGIASYSTINLTDCNKKYVLEWSLFFTGFITSVIFQIWDYYKHT